MSADILNEEEGYVLKLTVLSASLPISFLNKLHLI